MILNSIIFVCLGLGAILFQFIVLGWGASASSPDFNVDISLMGQIIILALLSLKKFKSRINYEMVITLFFVSLAYLILKFFV